MDKLEELSLKIKQFCEDRDWDQFHNPKDLAIGISTEASELLEHFRFLNGDEIQNRINDSMKKEEIGDELADVLFFVLRFAQMTGLSLEECFERKMAKNAMKYPVEKARGQNLKYDELGR